MSRAVLSIGSNLGDRLAYLNSVCAALASNIVAVSGVYSTLPWGGVEQGDYFNAVIIAEDIRREPADWLAFSREAESAAARAREVRWGPRTLDVDVISVERDGKVVVSDDPELTLPHPRASVRAFVLMPWLDADPDAALWTVRGPRPLAGLIAALPEPEREGVQRTTLTLSSAQSGPT